MRREVTYENGDAFRARDLPFHVLRSGGRLAKAQDATAGQIGQAESRLAISTIGGAENREEGGVLRDGHQLPLAQGPASGGEVTCKDSDFSEKWI